MGAIIGAALMLLLIIGVGFAKRVMVRDVAEFRADPAKQREANELQAWVIGARVFQGVVGLGIALLLVLSCLVTVSTKNVGIITAFGHVEGHLSNGLHVVAPWDSVTEMDAAIQTDNYGAQKQVSPGAGVNQDCITIRIAFQQTACAHATIRWRIRPAGADGLFQNYRTFDNVRDSLVTREFQTALNTQFAAYNPLNSVTTIDANGNTTGPTQPPTVAFGGRIADQMRREIGHQIEVLSVFTPLLSFDKATQGRINQLQQQVALTRIATQAIATNQAQATANRKLGGSVNNSPNVLVAQCLNLLEQIQKSGGTWPIGFNCWPGGGSGTAGIIVNPTPKRKAS